MAVVKKAALLICFVLKLLVDSTKQIKRGLIIIIIIIITRRKALNWMIQGLYFSGSNKPHQPPAKQQLKCDIEVNVFAPKV